MRRSGVVVLLTMAALVAPVRARAQDRDVRFAITAVGDTTVTFRAGRMTWVVRARNAYVADPRRRDELIANLRVVSLSNDGAAVAVITGQTGRITLDHVVIAQEPPRHWYRNLALWLGAGLGLAVGFGLGRI